jgi:hypothetical protein
MVRPNRVVAGVVFAAGLGMIVGAGSWNLALAANLVPANVLVTRAPAHFMKKR